MNTVKCWGADCPNTALVVTVDRMLLCALCHEAHGGQAGDRIVAPILVLGTYVSHATTRLEVDDGF